MSYQPNNLYHRFIPNAGDNEVLLSGGVSALPEKEPAQFHSGLCDHLKTPHNEHVDSIHRGELHYVNNSDANSLLSLDKCHVHKLDFIETNANKCKSLFEHPFHAKVSFPEFQDDGIVMKSGENEGIGAEAPDTERLKNKHGTFLNSKVDLTHKTNKHLPPKRIRSRRIEQEVSHNRELEKAYKFKQMGMEGYYKHPPIHNQERIIPGDSIDYVANKRLRFPCKNHYDDRGPI